ncbi:hypothetical protein Gpo141_00013393 [Globisporangium polare]
MIDTKENEERGRMICQTLAYVVESLVEPSEYATVPYQHPSKFEAFRAPGISIRDYLMRIHKYASCSPECFVLALVYIDRLQRMQGFVLTELNVHRVVITSVVLAAKFFDDHYFNNAYYAKVGGVLCKEMNELEIEYLLLINFSLHVPTDTYARFYNDLSNHYTFTSVRTPYMQPSPYYQMHHYVAEDPENAGQLVYFTDYVPRVQETRHSHHNRSQQQPVPPQQVHQQQLYQQPQPQHVVPQPHHVYQQQPQQYPPHPQQQQHYNRRTIEEPPTTAKGAYAVASSSSSPKTAARITTTTGTTTSTTATGRASGQKRRSAVALGVNA